MIPTSTVRPANQLIGKGESGADHDGPAAICGRVLSTITLPLNALPPWGAARKTQEK